MSNLRGYISSRRLEDNNIIDQSVQNLVIRKACDKHGFIYMLSATEYGMKNCFLMLNQVLQDAKKNNVKKLKMGKNINNSTHWNPNI